MFICSFSMWVFGFSLSMQMFALHSLITCWGCRIFILTLYDQVLGSHSPCTYLAYSPSRCWIFKVFLFSELIFHGVFILSLSVQVLGSHSPFRCLVYALQSHIYSFFFRKNHFHTLTLRPGFRFSISVHIFD